MKSGTVLVTGASGFLGSAVAEQLLASGAAVRATGRGQARDGLLPDYRRADLLGEGVAGPLVTGVDAVVHCAGLAHQFGRRTGSSNFQDVNARATVRLVEAAATAGVTRFILVSSVAVYGPGDAEPRDESAACHPVGPYAESKFAAEQAAWSVAAHGRMSLTILRFATLYGEGDPGNVGRLMQSLDRGRFVWVGDGSNRKSLIHREDAARACVGALDREQGGPEVYNVTGSPCSMREVVIELSAALGRPVPRWHIPARLVQLPLGMAAAFAGRRGRIERVRVTLDAWLRDDVYSGRKFSGAFEFETCVSLREGIRRQVGWYRKREAR